LFNNGTSDARSAGVVHMYRGLADERRLLVIARELIMKGRVGEF
jgi:hypothetical protein